MVGKGTRDQMIVNTLDKLEERVKATSNLLSSTPRADCLAIRDRPRASALSACAAISSISCWWVAASSVFSFTTACYRFGKHKRGAQHRHALSTLILYAENPAAMDRTDLLSSVVPKRNRRINSQEPQCVKNYWFCRGAHSERSAPTMTRK